MPLNVKKKDLEASHCCPDMAKAFINMSVTSVLSKPNGSPELNFVKQSAEEFDLPEEQDFHLPEEQDFQELCRREKDVIVSIVLGEEASYDDAKPLVSLHDEEAKYQVLSQHYHVFGDASDLGYGACVYITTQFLDGRPTVRLVLLKGRVATRQKISTSRLELCTALLSTEVVEKNHQSLRSVNQSRQFHLLE